MAASRRAAGALLRRALQDASGVSAAKKIGPAAEFGLRDRQGLAGIIPGAKAPDFLQYLSGRAEALPLRKICALLFLALSALICVHPRRKIPAPSPSRCDSHPGI